MEQQTLDDIIQQEIMRARAEVLSRAGHLVEEALLKLEAMREYVDHLTGVLEADYSRFETRQALVEKINDIVDQHNDLLKYAQLRYHYLIITREALGLRHHQRVAETYKLPPKMRRLKVQP